MSPFRAASYLVRGLSRYECVIVTISSGTTGIGATRIKLTHAIEVDPGPIKD
jgi:hypothetical protein